MTQGPRITVVGSLHYDILVTGDDRPRKGETLFGREWARKCGGKGGNQALEAGRHGARVRFAGAVGRDIFGDELVDTLASAGIDVAAVERLDGIGSGMSVALFDAGGDYGAVVVSGANWHIRTDAPELIDMLDSCEALVLQNEIPAEANIAAARRAHAAGGRVILNAAPTRDLPRDLLAIVDILVVNEIEAADITGAAPIAGVDDAMAAARALSGMVASAVVTLGGNGLVVAQVGNAPRHVPGHDVAMVSTHGAGDAFVGALAARVAAGADLMEACRYGNAAAAALVGTPEARRPTLGAADTAALLDGTAA